jgi:hypothetical protein
MASKFAVERIRDLFFFTSKSHTTIIPAFIRKVPGSRFEPATEDDEWKKIWKEVPAS